MELLREQPLSFGYASGALCGGRSARLDAILDVIGSGSLFVGTRKLFRATDSHAAMQGSAPDGFHVSAVSCSGVTV